MIVIGFTTKSILKANEFENQRKCSNNPLRRFIYGLGLDKPIFIIDINGGNVVFYIHFDGLGSIAAFSDVNNAIVEMYCYNVCEKFVLRLEKLLDRMLMPKKAGRPKKKMRKVT